MFSGTGNDAGDRRIYRNVSHFTSIGRTAPVVAPLAADISACPMNAQIQVQQEQQSVQQQQREALRRAAVPGPGRGIPVV